jgi:hypothetical protein
MFYTHVKDEKILHVWHHLNEVHRTFALQHFLYSHDWLDFK